MNEHRVFTPRARRCLMAQFNRLAQEYGAKVISDAPIALAPEDREASPLYELRTRYGVAQVSAEIGKRLAQCVIQFASPADAYAALIAETTFNRLSGKWSTYEAPGTAPDLCGRLFVSEIRAKLSRIAVCPMTADRFVSGESVAFADELGGRYVAAYRAALPGQRPHVCVINSDTGEIRRDLADEADARAFFAQLQAPASRRHVVAA
jgi:hypothetical protein